MLIVVAVVVITTTNIVVVIVVVVTSVLLFLFYSLFSLFLSHLLLFFFVVQCSSSRSVILKARSALVQHLSPQTYRGTFSTAVSRWTGHFLACSAGTVGGTAGGEAALQEGIQPREHGGAGTRASLQGPALGRAVVPGELAFHLNRVGRCNVIIFQIFIFEDRNQII